LRTSDTRGCRSAQIAAADATYPQPAKPDPLPPRLTSALIPQTLPALKAPWSGAGIAWRQRALQRDLDQLDTLARTEIFDVKRLRADLEVAGALTVEIRGLARVA